MSDVTATLHSADAADIAGAVIDPRLEEGRANLRPLSASRRAEAAEFGRAPARLTCVTSFLRATVAILVALLVCSLSVGVPAGATTDQCAPPGVQSDQFLLYFDSPNTPITYLAHSNILPSGMTTVLTNTQIHALGTALKAIHERFSPAYGPAAGNNGWYAMDVEFKFDSLDGVSEPTLQIKQARSNPGRGQ